MAKTYRRKKDGRFVAAVSLGFTVNEDGKRVRERRVFYGETKGEAERKRNDAIAREGGSLVRKPQSGALSSWMAAWLGELEHSMSPAGYVNYKLVWVKHAEPLVGTKKMADFRPKDVVTLYRRLAERHVAPSQIAKLKVVLHRAFEVASQRGDYLGRNPFGLVERPTYRAKERTSLTLPEAQRLLTACAASGDRHEAAIVIALTCGMRLGEILGLKFGDINWRAKSLSVRRSLQESNGRFSFSEGKTATARRKIALGSIALEALRRREAIAEHTKPDDLIFSTAAGTPVSRTNFRSRTFTPILTAAKVKVRIHDLRHTFASLLLQQGTPVKVTAEALGHANPGITQRLYQHVIGDLQAQATSTLDKALRSKRGKR